MGILALLTGAIYLLLLLVLIVFLFCTGYIYYTHVKYDHIPGPPRESFFLGHSPSLMKMMKNNLIIYDPFFEWMEKYGPVIRLNGVHKVMVFVISPEGVKEFLMSPKYTKDDFYDNLHSMFGARFLGKGLLTDRDRDHWHKQRRIMDPAFNKSYLLGSMGTFNEKAEELVDKLLEKADWKTPIRMHEIMSRLTLDVIAKIAFGMELNAVREDQRLFPQTISMVMKGMVEARDPLSVFYPSKQGFIREVKRNIDILRKTGKECIEQRIKAIQDGEETPKDILTQILKGGELEEGCTLEDLIDNFVTFFIAGQETTANQLSFAIMELGRNPDVLDRLRDEVDEVIGSRRDIEYEDLGKLQYMSQVLKETLRLYPTAPGTSRTSLEEIVIEGVRIPSGSHVMLNTYIMCRMEKYFPDPLVFNPDRFHPDAPKTSHVYFPFSLGPRTCIGQVFSQMEAKVVIAKFLQRFEFELVEGQSFRMTDTGTLRPLDGVICRLRPRAERKTSKK
ncbi:cholesterol 24-hydroxylase-like [Leptodactylus fuscus]|uniref:cholesterol 24-hydroxylase-like n=1 Tax=Leptodactylus fuscus TaxID=238119 RepID=UPI003F4E62C4